MKISKRGMPWSKKRTIVIHPQKMESLDYARAEWLRASVSAYLIPFQYDLEKSKLVYDITGYTSLKERLQTTLSNEDFTYLLIGMLQAIMLCSKEGYSSSELIFDPSRVFVDEEGTPVFIFVPLKGVVLGVDNSPLTLLKALGNAKQLKFEMADDAVRSEHLADFVRREEVWSINNFKSFMEREFGVGFDAEGLPYAIDTQESQFKLKGDTAGSTGQKGNTSGFGGFSGFARERSRTQELVLVRKKTGERFSLPEGVELAIGKGTNSDIQISGNNLISRIHVFVFAQNGKVSVRDNGSTNGTVIAGRRLAPNEEVRIGKGDALLLADEEFVIE